MNAVCSAKAIKVCIPYGYKMQLNSNDENHKLLAVIEGVLFILK